MHKEFTVTQDTLKLWLYCNGGISATNGELQGICSVWYYKATTIYYPYPMLRINTIVGFKSKKDNLF